MFGVLHKNWVRSSNSSKILRFYEFFIIEKVYLLLKKLFKYICIISFSYFLCPGVLGTDFHCNDYQFLNCIADS